MARHAHAKPTDRGLVSAVLIAVVAPVVAFFATDGDVDQLAAAAAPVVANAVPDGWQVVPVAPAAFSSTPSVVQSGSAAGAGTGQIVAASRYRIAVPAPTLLPVGRCNEQGLQVKTILVSRAVSAAFPEIQNMGGVRPDSKPWHPNGLAVDIMIPNPGSDAGIALGDEIVAFVMKNAKRFGIQDAIWRGTYYTPSGPSGSGYGHYDHVHVTTTGGGYPTGGEAYYR